MTSVIVSDTTTTVARLAKTRLYLATGLPSEGSVVGYEVIAVNDRTATITFKRASFWRRLRAWPRLFLQIYGVLRPGTGRWAAFHAADTSAFVLLKPGPRVKG